MLRELTATALGKNSLRWAGSRPIEPPVQLDAAKHAVYRNDVEQQQKLYQALGQLPR